MFSSLTEIVDSHLPNIDKSILMRSLNEYKSSSSVNVIQEVAGLIDFLCSTDKEVNLKAVLNSINSIFSNINWRTVYEAVLYRNKKVANVDYLRILVDCWITIGGTITVPYEIMFQEINKSYQTSHTESEDNFCIQYYKSIIDNSTGNINLFSNILFRKLVTKEDFKSKYKRNIDYESNLNCVELFEYVSDADLRLFDYIKNKSIEYCIIGLFSIIVERNSEYPNPNLYLDSFFTSLLSQFVESNTSHFVFFILFNRNKELMIQYLCKIRASLTRCLDIILEHKNLPLIIDYAKESSDNDAYVDFCFDIIILACRRDHLNLEIWIGNCNSGYLIEYIYKKVKGNSNSVYSSSQNNGIFPLTKSIISSIVNSISVPEHSEKITFLKNCNIEVSSDKATSFMTEIAQSSRPMEDYAGVLRTISLEDPSLCKKIFGILVDNYNGLYKLTNSDVIAKFYGLILKEYFTSSAESEMALQWISTSFKNHSISQIKNALINNASDREYNFSFRILEIFYNYCPDQFAEIEDIIKDNLVKKELVIVDDQSIRLRTIQEILYSCSTDHSGDIFSILNLQNYSIIDSIIGSIFKENSLRNKKLYLSKINSNCEISILDRYNSSDIITAAFYKIYIVCGNASSISLINSNNLSLLNNIVDYSIFHSIDIADTIWKILNFFLTSKIENEHNFANFLGFIYAKIVISRNRMVEHDFQDYLLRSIEYKRVKVAVAFVTNFFNVESIIYTPNSPFMIVLEGILADIYSYTLNDVREYIKMAIDPKKTVKKPKNTIKALGNYILPFCSNSNHISLNKILILALDFSIRESAIIVEKYMEITNEICNSIKGIDTSNVKINLLNSLIRINSKEVLKTAIYGNVRHFTKLAGVECSDIWTVIEDNLAICIEILERVGMTKMLESAPTSLTDLELPFNIVKYRYFQKKSLRKVENNEFQEIRGYLLGLGKNQIIKKRNFIYDEFPELLGPNKYKKFAEILTYLNGKQDECFELSKYLVGEIVKHRHKDDAFLFDFLSKIFQISFKTKKEIAGWLIYTPQRDIHLVTRFIEYGFIRIEELDTVMAGNINENINVYNSVSKNSPPSHSTYNQQYQHTSSTPNSAYSPSSTDFARNLLRHLILGNVAYCTVYDFIHTLEAISKKDPTSQILKEMEGIMIDFNDPSSQTGSKNVFDEFCEASYNTPGDSILFKFKEKYKPEQLNFKTALRSCWKHFVTSTGIHKYYKLDVLAGLCKINFCTHLYSSLEILVQAYKKRMYMFNTFYCRYFCKILDFSKSNSLDTFNFLFSITEILSPESFPSFSSQYIEIFKHEYWNSLNNSDHLKVCKNLFFILKNNQKYERSVYDYFVRKEAQIKVIIATIPGNNLLSLCPGYSVNLKNFICSLHISKINFSSSKSPGTVFKGSCKILQECIKQTDDVCSIVDSIALNSVPPKKNNLILQTLENPSKRNSFILAVLTRFYGLNIPEGIKIVYEFISKNYSEIVQECEERYFKINE